MAVDHAGFRLNEEISFTGKAMRVAGLLRLEDANAGVTTRYLLAEAGGAPLILEENGGNFSLLRPFPPGAQPEAVAGTITVMNKKYTLAGVRKLKILGTEGQPPGGMPKAELLVSGLFAGEMGSLLREMPAGASTQVFFSSKPVDAADVLSAEQLAARREAVRNAAEAEADALAEHDAQNAGRGETAQIVALCIAAALILLGLAYAFLKPA